MPSVIRGNDDFDSSQVGAVLQVIQATSSDQIAVNTIQDVDLMSASITPIGKNSKILVTIHAYVGSGNNETWWLKRDSLKVGGAGLNNSVFQEPDSFISSDSAVSIGSNSLACLSFNYLDEPNTVNEITYTMGALLSSGGISYFNRSGTLDATSSRSTITLTEIGD